MIKIKCVGAYLFQEEEEEIDCSYQTWNIGLFETIEEAVECMKDNFITKIIKINDYSYQGLDKFESLFYFKFWDTDKKQFITVKDSPWKIGLKELINDIAL